MSTLCITCRYFNAECHECWHPINTWTSPVDGRQRHDSRWHSALGMRKSTSTTDCGPQARLYAPKLEVA